MWARLMLRFPKIIMPLLLVMGAAPVRPSARLTAGSEGSTNGADQAAQHATLRPAAAAAADIPFRNVDSDVEQRLLELANQSRAQAAASPLTLDAGLSRAARAHAEAMVAAGQLSHQFLGEPSLPQRLATTSNLLLERSGENVALDYNAAGAHQHLMLSPHHRENLLNPAYNVVGLGVVRSGDRLYIVQDFGHALPNYSLPEVKDRIAATVEGARHRAKRPRLARRDLPSANAAACSMEQADKLGTSPIHQLAQRYTVLTYTSLHPDTLPSGADRAIGSRKLRGFSVGACYGRTATYPTGMYWVVLSLE
jgi:uncharacterized protein YkwD